MKQVAVGLVWVSVASAIVGFMLPWAQIDMRALQAPKPLQDVAGSSDTLRGLAKDLGRITATITRGARTITGELPQLADIPKEVSGVQIPRLANQKNAQTAIALMELFIGEQQHIGLKSYAVYLLPGIALVCGLLVTFLRQRLVPWLVAGLCVAIAAVGFWKLLTTNTQALVIAITIGPGLWLSLWAYVLLAGSSALSAVAPGKGRT